RTSAAIPRRERAGDGGMRGTSEAITDGKVKSPVARLVGTCQIQVDRADGTAPSCTQAAAMVDAEVAPGGGSIDGVSKDCQAPGRREVINQFGAGYPQHRAADDGAAFFHA